MLRYDLDKLGWYDFEGLVQSLLKHHLGLGIEAWGGTGDWGRDAYFAGDLRYPTKDESAGPFLFQCKFVDAANAPGASPRASIRKAIALEIAQIPHRLTHWGSAPSRYVFLTNAPLGAEDRKWVAARVSKALPSTTAHIHDGQDLCAWLDNAGQVARGFPQLLGLRDLEELLSQWNFRDIFTRSEIAISDAQALSSVFVPTSPYSQALAILTTHGFAVLEGPPEMGKTAIARMIALTYLARGWQVIECRLPEDFLKAFNKEHQQIFVADDFFGRTEYDPFSN